MTTEEIIKAKATEFINNQKLFTSVNVTNSIKKDGIWVKNSDVAYWLRQNFDQLNEDLGDSYCITQISVLQNSQQANLYHPFFADPTNYNDRDIQAITPDEFEKLHNYSITDAKAQSSNKSQTNSIIQPATSTQSSNKPLTLPTRTLTGKSQGRISVPGAFIKALGLKPGDNVAASGKIKIPNLSNKIIVQSDYRVSFSRDLLSLGKGPVRMYIKDGTLGIEKV